MNNITDIQVGDRVTYIIDRKDIVTSIMNNIANIDFLINNDEHDIEIIKIERPKYEIVEEKEELLTEEEKEFLKSYIKLLNIDNLDYIERELNELYIYTQDTFYRIDIDNMFSKLIVAKHYTLEELGVK